MAQQKSHGLLRVLGVAGVLTVTGQAWSSGLQITEQSVTGLGRAFAGGSLANDDVSAVYYNPADMMLSKGMQAQAGVTFIGISTEASNAGSQTRLPVNLGDVLTKPPGTVVPNVMLSPNPRMLLVAVAASKVNELTCVACSPLGAVTVRSTDPAGCGAVVKLSVFASTKVAGTGARAVARASLPCSIRFAPPPGRWRHEPAPG